MDMTDQQPAVRGLVAQHDLQADLGNQTNHEYAEKTALGECRDVISWPFSSKRLGAEGPGLIFF